MERFGKHIYDLSLTGRSKTVDGIEYHEIRERAFVPRQGLQGAADVTTFEWILADIIRFQPMTAADLWGADQ